MKVSSSSWRPVLYLSIGLLLGASSNHSVASETRIAILDFELNDVTPSPGTPQELARTASIRPLLTDALESRGGYKVIQIGVDTQTEADAGFGYLFEYHDVAAQLGEGVGAEYVVVGRVHKPSFLFAYLMVHLVDVRTQELVGDYIVEVKGPQKKITQKGVETVAKKIHNTIHP